MPYRKNISIIISVIALILISGPLFAQNTPKQKSVKKQRKEFLQLQEERDAASDKAMDEKREKHLKLQTKETRKRMKANKKKMKRMKKRGHSEPWIKRLFMRKGK
jgi:hypothetical protein